VNPDRSVIASKFNPIPALSLPSVVRIACALLADSGATQVAVVDPFANFHQHQPSGSPQHPGSPTDPLVHWLQLVPE
jgi:hypothetical protein